MTRLSDRQQTGVWFIVTGLLILFFWVSAYAIVNWGLDTGFIDISEDRLSGDQAFVAGASAVVSVQAASLIGLPILLAGVLQVVTGANKTSAKSKKK